MIPHGAMKQPFPMNFAPWALMGDTNSGRCANRPPAGYVQGVGASHQLVSDEEMYCLVTEQFLAQVPVFTPGPAWIRSIDGIIAYERIEVYPTRESDRIF